MCWCWWQNWWWNTVWDQRALCVPNKIDWHGISVDFSSPNRVILPPGCLFLTDNLYNLVESLPVLLPASTLFRACPHLSLHRYQISIESAWHFLTHHLFHASLCFANDAWPCNVANLTALPMLKGYSPLIKAEVRPFIASSSPLIVPGVSQPARRADN